MPPLLDSTRRSAGVRHGGCEPADGRSNWRELLPLRQPKVTRCPTPACPAVCSMVCLVPRVNHRAGRKAGSLASTVGMMLGRQRANCA
jgi:hypothetical protein